MDFSKYSETPSYADLVAANAAYEADGSANKTSTGIAVGKALLVCMQECGDSPGALGFIAHVNV